MEEFMDLVFQPLRNFGRNVMEFVPDLLAMLIIFAGGLLIAWLVKSVFLRAARVFSFDAWCDRAGLTALIRKGDLWSRPSDLFAGALYWMLVIIFLMVALGALRFEAINNLSSQFFLYLPRVFSALLILVIGYIIAGFLSRAILIAAVNSGYHYAAILAETARLLMLVLILAMALEQLQIAPGIVIAAFSIIFGGIVLALAVAFGMGGIDAARKIIEKGSEEKKEMAGRDIEHL
jgi:hypothetical protein